MARQVINTGSTDNDPSAESVNAAFTKCNAMFLDLFTANSLSGRQVIDLAGADTIRAAFQKVDANTLTLFTMLGLTGRTDINDGGFADDPSAESIRSAFTDVNTMTATLYSGAAGPGVYVATTGNDTTGNGSIGSPYRTINKGLGVLPSSGTLYIRAGTYVERISNPPSGTAATYTVIRAYPGESVTLRPTGSVTVVSFSGSSYIEIRDLELDGSATTLGTQATRGVDTTASAHHLRIIGCDIHHNIAAGVFISRTTNAMEVIDCRVHENGYHAFEPNVYDHGIYASGHNCVYDGNEIYLNANYAMQIYHVYPDNRCDNNIIRNCIFHDNGQVQNASVVVGTGDNNQVYNNVFYNIAGSANFALKVQYNSPTNTKFYHNTFHNIANTAMYIAPGCTGTIVRNNAINQNTGSVIDNQGSGSTISNNAANKTGTGVSVVNANLGFVNAAAADFHLQATSPLINAGITVAGVPTDADGVTRSAPPDIGAFERP